MSDVIRILADIERGDRQAAAELLPLVYDELRRLAASRLAREAPGQTLQPTALVHEAYLRLVGSDPDKAFDGRGHFFAAAAEAMRRILIDRARARHRRKRGGGGRRVPFDLEALLAEPLGDDLLALDEALTALASEDPAAASLVQLRIFAGLTLREAAVAMGVSRSTADRDWSYARAWLCQALAGPETVGNLKKSSPWETAARDGVSGKLTGVSPAIRPGAGRIGPYRTGSFRTESGSKAKPTGSHLMTPARPDVKAIFTEALRIPEGAGRAAYLDRACGGDAGLRLRVEALLAAHARADDVLGPAGETSVGDLATTGHDPGAAEAIGPTNPGPTMGRPKADAPGPTTAPGSDRDAETLARGNRVRYFGDYEIRRELGRGGMGVVYEARQVSLNRPVALKMVRAGLLAGDDELRRFQNEAEAVALLDHPGIVPVYEVGAHDSQHYFSMKLVPGGSLVPLLTRYRDDPRAAARLAAEAAEAVAHAHARGILHRDLKPANILVDDQGRPHVTDFGLAKKVEADVELTQSGAILGTPAYMSPEQASGRRGAVTTASDVYGLGAVLYSLLTGRAPFGGDGVVETIDAVRHRPPEPPRQLNAALPRDLETICLRCLEKDPRRRYPTAQALAEDLRAWLDSRPIAARRVGPAERAWLWCRRRPAVAALSAAVALAVVGGAAATIAVQYAANRRLDAKNFELDRANAGLLDAIGQKDQANAALAQANIRVQARFDLAREAIRSLKQGVEEEEALKEDRLRPLRDKLLGSARRFYDRLGGLLQDQTDDASKAVLAESYAELGKLIDEIGQKPEAREAYRKAVAIRRELAAERAGASTRIELAGALNTLGQEARRAWRPRRGGGGARGGAVAGRAAGDGTGSDDRGAAGAGRRLPRDGDSLRRDRRGRSGDDGLAAGPRGARAPGPRGCGPPE